LAAILAGEPPIVNSPRGNILAKTLVGGGAGALDDDYDGSQKGVTRA